MAKINLKKPFITAVISSMLFAGAIVAVPLIASAENESNLVLNESLNDVDSNEGKDDKERSPRDKKHKKGFHMLGEIFEDLGLEREVVKAGAEAGQSLNELAEANGISSQAVIEAVTNAFTERLNNAVSEGKISGEKALEMAAELQEKAEEFVNSPIGEGKDDKERSPRDKKHKKGFHMLGEIFEDLGLEREVVKAGAEAGQSLNELAEANGISSQAVIEAVTNAFTERLNNAVSEGKISGEKALEMAAELQEKAEEFVNSPIGEGKDDKERSPRDNKSDKEWSSPDNKKPRGNLGPPPNA